MRLSSSSARGSRAAFGSAAETERAMRPTRAAASKAGRNLRTVRLIIRFIRESPWNVVLQRFLQFADVHRLGEERLAPADHFVPVGFLVRNKRCEEDDGCVAEQRIGPKPCRNVAAVHAGH